MKATAAITTRYPAGAASWRVVLMSQVAIKGAVPPTSVSVMLYPMAMALKRKRAGNMSAMATGIAP